MPDVSSQIVLFKENDDFSAISKTVVHIESGSNANPCDTLFQSEIQVVLDDFDVV